MLQSNINARAVAPQRASKTLQLIIMLVLGCVFTRCRSQTVEAKTLDNGLDLTIGLSGNGGGGGGEAANAQQVTQREQQMSKIMENIMNDGFENDFVLSITMLNHLAEQLEAFIRSEHLTDVVHQGASAISAWAVQQKVDPNQMVVRELGLIVGTFWAKFKPLVEKIIGERPPNLGPTDLDFRCKRRFHELSDLMALASQSSLYSIYLDTFLSEFYVHCLFRKLALIKGRGIEPTPLVKQFVDIYLGLPTMDPMQASSREAQEATISQLLAGRAQYFQLQSALTQIGPLTAAARLVVDPRTFLAATPGPEQLDQLVQEFKRDCGNLILALDQVWDNDYDEFVRALSTGTTNLDDINKRVKFVAPQLVYGTICGQLVNLPEK